MIAVTGLLVVVHFLSRRIDPGDSTLAGLRTVFDFDQEGTLPTWWNALLLAAISAVLFAAAFRWVTPGAIVAIVLAIVAARWCRTLPDGVGRLLVLDVCGRTRVIRRGD